MEQATQVATKTDVGRISCYHCGDSCPTQNIELDNKYFCCNGCKIVYSLLTDNGLENYYLLNDDPGISLRKKKRQHYAFLDDPETIERLISYADENRQIIQFYVPQIHCSSCLFLLENLHKIDDRILYARVNFLTKNVKITIGPEISIRELVEVMDKIGYAPQILLQDLDDQRQQPLNRSLLYKLGLAGFVFGNIMLFSFPEYLGLVEAHDYFLKRVFSLLNILLAIPLLLYCAKDYFRSAIEGLKQRLITIDIPISLGILVLFSRSIYEIITASGAGYLDSLAGLLFFLLVGRYFQEVSYARISFDKNFKSYFPIVCSTLEGSSEQQITLDKLKPGHLVVIRHGELIPADAVLVDGEGRIDYRFVTGESRTVRRYKGDQLYAGGRQIGGRLTIRLDKTVSNSYLTQLWNEHNMAESGESHVSGLANKVARTFTWLILAIGFLTLLYWLPRSIPTAVNAFSAVLIIACPCAIALSIPFTLGTIVRLLAQKGIYIKNTQVIERLSQVNSIVFDKTGTITTSSPDKTDYVGKKLSPKSKVQIFSLASQSNHPVSKEIAKFFSQNKYVDVDSFQEKKGLGIEGNVGGRKIRIGSTTFINNTENNKEGTRIEIDGKVVGVFYRENVYRKNLDQVIRQIGQKKKLAVLSGDHANAKKELRHIFPEGSDLLFNQGPDNKQAYIAALQKKGEHVAMIGDGLNDAGALAQSHVGIILTDDTSNFTPASDIIVHADHFSMLDRIFKLSRKAIYLIYAAYMLALLYNIIGISIAVQGKLSPMIAAILMPASSITIVLFGLVMGSALVYRTALVKPDTETKSIKQSA